MTSRRTLLKIGTAALALSVVAPATLRASEPMPVVATFSILGDMVARIGGEHIALTTLVGRKATPCLPADPGGRPGG